jgi:hypothetical protein
MPVETAFLDDFSGGEVDYFSSLEFNQGQWSLLKGFVFDKEKRLRSQWPGNFWDASVIEVPEVEE